MATTNSSSVLRFSGMNSGLDTESIVNAMTAATKLKITKQNRKAITLKWKQEAYQGITTKLTDFQNKYPDMLNSKVNLKSKSTFTKYGFHIKRRRHTQGGYSCRRICTLRHKRSTRYI